MNDNLQPPELWNNLPTLDELLAIIKSNTAKSKQSQRRVNKKASTPRPSNSFILFRTWYNHHTRQQTGGNEQRAFSTTIAKIWNKVPEYVNRYFYRLQELVKVAHAQEHPGYKYKPIPKKVKEESSKQKGNARKEANARGKGNNVEAEELTAVLAQLPVFAEGSDRKNAPNEVPDSGYSQGLFLGSEHSGGARVIHQMVEGGGQAVRQVLAAQFINEDNRHLEYLYASTPKKKVNGQGKARTDITRPIKKQRARRGNPDASESLKVTDGEYSAGEINWHPGPSYIPMNESDVASPNMYNLCGPDTLHHSPANNGHLSNTHDAQTLFEQQLHVQLGDYLHHDFLDYYNNYSF